MKYQLCLFHHFFSLWNLNLVYFATFFLSLSQISTFFLLFLISHISERKFQKRDLAILSFFFTGILKTLPRLAPVWQLICARKKPQFFHKVSEIVCKNEMGQEKLKTLNKFSNICENKIRQEKTRKKLSENVWK